MERRVIDPKRMAFLPMGLGLLFLGAALTQARVQVSHRDEILESAEKTRRFVIQRTEAAKRGTIFTTDGKIVAQSEDAFVLGVDFAKVPHSRGFFMALGSAAGIAPSELEQAVAAKLRSRTWRRRMSNDQAAEVRAVKQSWRADGVSLHRDMQRSYPMAEVMSGIVGFVQEGVPKSGIERAQDKVLDGTDGIRKGIIDRRGAWLPSRMEETKRERQNGQSVTLTIDSTLQMAASQSIRKAVESSKADSGVAIVMEPRTGKILAMANWPSFDPNGNNTTLGPRVSDLNPAFMAVYEPGSTFKVLTLAKALDQGVVDDRTVVTCKLTLPIGKSWSISCDKKHGAHGICGLERAIAKSCNVSASTWALRVGVPGMIGYMEGLGLVDKPHLGLPGEVKGQFNYSEYAKPLQIAQVGFGQSLNSTPVSLCAAYAMLANDGVLPRPTVVEELGGSPVPPAEGKRIVKPEAARKVLRLMESVIQSEEGTGYKLRIPGYRLAGKTGTAQKTNRQTKSMVGGGYVASFVGYVPADQPRAVVLVMVDAPKGTSYYGGQIAGPVFKELASAIIRRFEIPPASAAKPKSGLQVEVSAKQAVPGKPRP